MMHYNPNGNVPHYVTLSRAALVESGDARMFEQHRYVIACKSMNNIFSYCGLVDVRINGSDKDLPVLLFIIMIQNFYFSTMFHFELEFLVKLFFNNLIW